MATMEKSTGFQVSVKTDISDELAAVAYLTMQHQELLPVIFYEGVPGLKWFLQWFAAVDAQIFGCFATPAGGGGDPVLAGLGWFIGIKELNGVRRADIGMVFFREWQIENLPAEWCQEMIDFGFHRLGLDAIYGATPELNRAACMFSVRMGFHQAGPIPMACSWKGKACGLIMSTMTRDMWSQEK